MGNDKFNKIKDYWSNAAQDAVDDAGLRPTARDPYLQEAIEELMEGYLWPSARLLDVGCGDGLSSIRFSKKVDHVHGVDYIENFVKMAERNAEEESVENISFSQGDATDLSDISENVNPFDIAVSIRCLINLPEWEMQCMAIKEIASCMKTGGLYMCSEGWEEGWESLNELRVRCGIDPVTIVPYNRLIKRIDFETEAKKYFDIVNYQSLGFYLFMSRVLQPYIVKPNPPEHTHEINRIGMELQNCLSMDNYFSDSDYAGIYLLKKK